MNNLISFIEQRCHVYLQNFVVSYTLNRGQSPNESQKAVIIDMMKSVGEI